MDGTQQGRGPVLSDGVALADLFDLDKKEVALRLMSDPEVFDLELGRLFGRAWTLLAHESEVPNPGDFVLRQIGVDPVVVVRQTDGDIKVLLNVCTHRGMQVCRAEVGNASQFKCPYHGWTFGQDGRLLGAPFERAMYDAGTLDKAAWGLEPARVGVYAGLVFATWDPEAESLTSWLGDYAFYLDLMFDRTMSGMEVVGSPQRFLIRANWKTAGEQFNADGYHGPSLHASLMELAVRPGGDKPNAQSAGSIGVDISTPQGHGLRCVDRNVYAPMLGLADLSGMTAAEVLTRLPPPGIPPELVQELFLRLSEAQLKLLAFNAPAVGGMFPNVGLLAISPGAPQGGPGAAVGFHTFVPRSHDTFEMMHWNLVEKGASADYKKWADECSTFTLGSSGVFEQDDSEAWPSQQKSARGFKGRQVTMKYSSLLGENKPADWPGGGLVYDGFSKDDSQWNWWMRYRDFMVGEPW